MKVAADSNGLIGKANAHTLSGVHAPDVSLHGTQGVSATEEQERRILMPQGTRAHPKGPQASPAIEDDEEQLFPPGDSLPCLSPLEEPGLPVPRDEGTDPRVRADAKALEEVAVGVRQRGPPMAGKPAERRSIFGGSGPRHRRPRHGDASPLARGAGDGQRHRGADLAAK